MHKQISWEKKSFEAFFPILVRLPFSLALFLSFPEQILKLISEHLMAMW